MYNFCRCIWMTSFLLLRFTPHVLWRSIRRGRDQGGGLLQMGVQQRSGRAAWEGCGPEVRHCLLHVVTGGWGRVWQQLILNHSGPLDKKQCWRLRGGYLTNRPNLILMKPVLSVQGGSDINYNHSRPFLLLSYLLWLTTNKNKIKCKKRSAGLLKRVNDSSSFIFWEILKQYKPTLLLHVNIDLYATWYMTEQMWCHTSCVEEGMMLIMSFRFVMSDQTWSSYDRDCFLSYARGIHVFKSTKENVFAEFSKWRMKFEWRSYFPPFFASCIL